jgi:tol-pal system protein YbgF
MPGLRLIGASPALLLAAWLVFPAQAAERPSAKRGAAPVVDMTKPVSSAAASQETLLQLLQQMEELQTQLRGLQNQLEVQDHALEKLKARERALIDDLDRRLRELERRGQGAQTPTAAGGQTQELKPATAEAKSPDAQEQQEYDDAFVLLKQGSYDRAIKGFRGFLAKYPNSSLADNAQYWTGEANYVLRNYKPALEEFSKVMNAYPNSPKLPDSLLKIGYIHYELGARDKARKALTDVIARYPNTAAAKLATKRLQEMDKKG